MKNCRRRKRNNSSCMSGKEGKDKKKNRKGWRSFRKTSTSVYRSRWSRRLATQFSRSGLKSHLSSSERITLKKGWKTKWRENKRKKRKKPKPISRLWQRLLIRSGKKERERKKDKRKKWIECWGSIKRIRFQQIAGKLQAEMLC